MNKYPVTHDQRRKDLAAIHLMAGQLGMDTADRSDGSEYRATLWAVACKHSAAELDWRGRKLVREHFEGLLKARGIKRPAPQPRKLADDPQSRKIRALWLELHAAGKVRNSSESALAAFVKRQTKVEALQWLSAQQASAVIEDLKKWLAR